MCRAETDIIRWQRKRYSQQKQLQSKLHRFSSRLFGKHIKSWNLILHWCALTLQGLLSDFDGIWYKHLIVLNSVLKNWAAILKELFDHRAWSSEGWWRWRDGPLHKKKGWGCVWGGMVGWGGGRCDGNVMPSGKSVKQQAMNRCFHLGVALTPDWIDTGKNFRSSKKSLLHYSLVYRAA